MNCLSCKPGYQLYESTNCLSCPKYIKYINYELTECLNEIPNGYYLKDTKMRTYSLMEIFIILILKMNILRQGQKKER